MTRPIIDTSHLDRTIAKLMTATGLSEEAAMSFRCVGYTTITRGQTAWTHGWWYAEDDKPMTGDDQALIDAGLIELGRVEHDGMSRVSYPALLTESGQAMARRVLAYEEAIRRRGMDSDDFADWQRAIAA